jgi:hypothetical protein
MIENNKHEKIKIYVDKYEEVKQFLPESLLYCIHNKKIKLDTIDLLIQLGADPHIKTSCQANCNIVNSLCMFSNRIDAIQHLVLKYNVDVNDKSSNGKTPLHNAIFGNWKNHKRVDVVKFLLDNGASPLLEDNEGMTPRQWLLYDKDFSYRDTYYYIEEEEDELNILIDEAKIDRIIIDMLKKKEDEIYYLLLLKGNALEKSNERMYDPRIWRIVLNYAQSYCPFDEEYDD